MNEQASKGACPLSKKIRYLLVIISLCLSLTITGCGLQALLAKKNKTSSTTGATGTVIVVSLNEEDPNKLLITKGIDDLAKKENVQVKYMDQSAVRKESPLKGAKVLIYQGGDASLLKTAETDKIPVLALSQIPPGVKLVGIITPDQEKVGELMAQTLVSKVAEGQIVILEGDPTETGFQERLAGNKVVFSKYPKITIQNMVSPPGSESIVKQGLVDFIQKNPSKVQGIMAHTEKLAALATDVLKQMQLDKKIILVGGQASVPSLERMSSGAQVGDVDTSPYLQGVNAYQWAQKIIKKESLDVNDSITSMQGEIPAKIIQVKAVTPDNLALIQKSYTLTLQSAEQAKKQTEQAGQATTPKDQGQTKTQGQSGAASGASSEGQPAKSSAIPAGVEKVTERIKTETTREYLDAQGKVIGTEKTANEQEKTVPPEMLKQQSEPPKDASQANQSSKDQANQSSKDQGASK